LCDDVSAHITRRNRARHAARTVMPMIWTLRRDRVPAWASDSSQA